MAVDRIVKRYFWAALGLLVGVAAFLNAQAISQFIGIALFPDEKQLAAPPPVAKASTIAT